MFYSLVSLFNYMLIRKSPKTPPVPRWVRDRESNASISQLAFGKSTQRVVLPAHTGTLPRMLCVETNRPVRLRFGGFNVEATAADNPLLGYEVFDVPEEATHVAAVAASEFEGGIVVWRMALEI